MSSPITKLLDSQVTAGHCPGGVQAAFTLATAGLLHRWGWCR